MGREGRGGGVWRRRERGGGGGGGSGRRGAEGGKCGEGCVKIVAGEHTSGVFFPVRRGSKKGGGVGVGGWCGGGGGGGGGAAKRQYTCGTCRDRMQRWRRSRSS